MNDKKLKPWAIVAGIVSASLLLGILLFNPLNKDLTNEAVVTAFIIYFICMLLATAIPFVRRKANLWRIISFVASLIILGILYFVIL